MGQSPGRQQLRTFGFMMSGIFLLIGLWPTAVGSAGPRWWGVLLAGLFGLPAWLAPARLHPLYRAWMQVGAWISWVNTRFILAVGFFGLVTPIALARRIVGRDSMRRRFEPDLPTYRVPRAPRRGDHLFHQY